MKRTVYLLAGFCCLLNGITFAQTNTTMKTSKSLVAYFSATGTTRAVAQQTTVGSHTSPSKYRAKRHGLNGSKNHKP